MDREILFRGKRKDKFKPGKWIYRYYVPCCFGVFPCRPAIVPRPDGQWEPFEVEPDTVGRCTGLTDKNGVKIFDGGRLYDPHENMIYIVEWSSEKAMFQMAHDWRRRNMEFSSYCEVIGNIHDNPELMGGDNDG